jgi:NADP-dependent 3-hydroxy acid dehydrogenase YdfG
MGKLDGKIALVTGGNSGIGLATAKRFAQEGAYVFITGRRDLELDAAAREIGRNVTAVRGGVSNLGDQKALPLMPDGASIIPSDDSSYITGTELFVDGGFAQV